VYVKWTKAYYPELPVSKLSAGCDCPHRSLLRSDVFFCVALDGWLPDTTSIICACRRPSRQRLATCPAKRHPGAAKI
jgi:hypothetical protein